MPSTRPSLLGWPAAGSSTAASAGRLGCNRLIELTPAEYEALRADPRRSAVVPDHEVADIERVVERHGHYAVVQADGEAAPIAERTDGRRLDP